MVSITFLIFFFNKIEDPRMARGGYSSREAWLDVEEPPDGAPRVVDEPDRREGREPEGSPTELHEVGQRSHRGRQRAVHKRLCLLTHFESTS